MAYGWYPNTDDTCPDCGCVLSGVSVLTIGGKTIRRECCCLCDCQAKDFDQRNDSRIDRFEAMRFESAFGDRKPRGDFDCDDGRNIDVMRVCRAYVDEFLRLRNHKANGLLLHGPGRQGKTFSAEAVAVALHRKGLRVIMDTAAGFVIRMQGKEAAQLREKAASCDLLVVDDIGASRDTTFGREAIYSLIDDRTASGRPVIATTNIDVTNSDAIALSDDSRALMRLVETCLPIKVKSSRAVANASDANETAKILGIL